MLKRISLVVFLFILLFAVSYGVHVFLLKGVLSFSLGAIYLFHLISACLVYIIVELVSSKLPNQAGYAYLMMMCLKIGFFVLIFQNDVFSKPDLSQFERISLVIPLFLFLIAEAIAVGRLLNNK